MAAIAVLALPVAAWAQVPGGATTGVGSQFELTFWQSVESGNDPALYEAYLAQYPNGTFATVARVKLAKLRQVAAPPAPAAASVPIPVPVPAATPAPSPPPVVHAAIVQSPAPSPAPQVATAAATVAPPSPATSLAVRERRAGRAPVPRPASSDDGDSAPYITPAPPTEPAMNPAPDNPESAALRRLLGALGDSQRSAVPPPAAVIETPD